MQALSIPTLIQGGLVLMVSGAWSDASRSSIRYLYPGEKNTAFAEIVLAVVVTFVMVVVVLTIQYVQNWRGNEIGRGVMNLQVARRMM